MELWICLLLADWKVDLHVEVVSSSNQLLSLLFYLSVYCTLCGLGDKSETACAGCGRLGRYLLMGALPMQRG